MKRLKRSRRFLKQRFHYTYIADGHHRAASAAKVRKALGDAATEDADYFLTTLFPSNQLYIMDYNRRGEGPEWVNAEKFCQRTRQTVYSGTRLLGGAYRPEELHSFGLYMDKNWYKLSF
jgi:uncharacterized protein (DUF1015 family)